MAWANNRQRTIGMVVRKKIGRPMFCGLAWCGWSQCGEENELAGIYQMRRIRAGIWKWYNDKFGRNQICFMRHYHKIYENTPAQQICAGKFQDAVLAWQGLTDEQKMAYNVIANKRSRKGYNFFISQYLKSN